MVRLLSCFVAIFLLLVGRACSAQTTTIDVVSGSANYPNMECINPENGKIDCPKKMGTEAACGKSQDGTPRICVGGGTADLGTCVATRKWNYYCQHIGYYFEEGKQGTLDFKKRGCVGTCEKDKNVCGYAPSKLSCHGDFRWIW